MISDIEIAWLAGLMEGEGYFGCVNYNNLEELGVNMTDEDVIYKVAQLIANIIGKDVRVATIDRYNKANPKWQYQYKIAIRGQDARMVMLAIVHHMCYRRRQRIWQVLNRYKAAKKAPVGQLAELMSNVVNLKA